MVTNMKFVTIFFDLEAPYLWRDTPKFDLNEAMQNICELLKQFKIPAVFNTCGVLAKNFPQLIAKLHDEGHEIASHGYAHENFLRISIDKLDKILSRTEKIIHNITGERPIGIRSPWVIRSKEIYSVVNKRGYKWTSNWYVPFWATKSHIYFHILSYPEWIIWNVFYDLKWRFHKKSPFQIDNVVEIPLLSPLDLYCIYPFPEPLKNSPDYSLKEAYRILIKHFKFSKEYFNLNFHPHVIGTCNRISLLDRILNYLSNQSDVHFVLPRQIVKFFPLKLHKMLNNSDK
jgi:peptidoglycan/xylan/chitin deacetylase (PgdA/CDA1 family)